MGYFWQAGKGQMAILANRENVQQLIESDETDAELRNKLILAQKLTRFAHNHLAIDDRDNYSSYVDTGRRHVVYNIIANPRFSIDPISWCFPIAGCVPYKGFFKQEMAIAERDGLNAKGYDTILYGVSAYSTLGWFSDPLLNTFIGYPETDLAGLIFHELAHSQVYFKDHANFNEAFATAVEIEGVKRWLATTENTGEIERLQQDRSRHESIMELVLEYRQKLIELYGSELSDEDKAQNKTLIIDQMKSAYAEFQQAGENNRFFDWWFSQDLNNAHFNLLTTYHRLVPGFLALLEKVGHDLNQFYVEVESLKSLSPQQRESYLLGLQ